MSIEDRNLKPGTNLVATYKKQEFTCGVVKTKDGVLYRLADGQEFKSLSSAGSAIMNGSAYLAQMALKALEVGGQEERLGALEVALGPRLLKKRR